MLARQLPCPQRVNSIIYCPNFIQVRSCMRSSRMQAVSASGASTASPPTQTASVVVFTTPGCPYCKKAKQTLKEQQLAFQVGTIRQLCDWCACICPCMVNSVRWQLPMGSPHISDAVHGVSHCVHSVLHCGGWQSAAILPCAAVLQEVDVSVNTALRQALQQATGQRTVPQVRTSMLTEPQS
jgi:glutaredoxin